MQLEPPDTAVLARPSQLTAARFAAGAGALALLLLSEGDAFFVALVLGVAAASSAVAVTVGLVAVSLLAAWGTTALDAIAGAQAVLGPAGFVQPVPVAIAAWTGAGACLAVAASAHRRFAAALLGLAAGLVVAGPSAARVDQLPVRLAAAAAGVAVATLAHRFIPRRASAVAGPAGAALSVVLAWAA